MVFLRQPSHVNAETPGCIHEGGELGYALSVSYGSVFDIPDLITVVVVGDGESETGPTSAAWHSHKWLDPKESGAVLPSESFSDVLSNNVTSYYSFSPQSSTATASRSPSARSPE